MTHTYHITGMTCDNCVKTVRDRLLKLADITSVNISLEKQQAEITMSRHVGIIDLQAALSGTKYVITEEPKALPHLVSAKDEEVISLKAYLPVFLIFGFITVATLLIQFMHDKFSMEEWMQHFMAGFFLTFSFFKLLDIPAFASSYSSYDIVARKWYGYGYIYPFIELVLGFSFLIPSLSLWSNAITFVVMGISIIGVLQSVLNKRKIQCACLGAVFNLPMSTVTIIEDAIMSIMSAVSLLYLMK